MLPYRILGTNPDGTDQIQNFDAVQLRRGDEGVRCARPLDHARRLRGVHSLIAKRDPGQGIVWAAFLCLIAGITITFYRPRCRIWARLTSDGRLAGRSARIATSTSSASSARCSTTSSRSVDPRDALERSMTTLHDLQRALFPTACPIGSADWRRTWSARGQLGPRPQATRAGIRGPRDRRPGDHPGTRAGRRRAGPGRSTT